MNFLQIFQILLSIFGQLEQGGLIDPKNAQHANIIASIAANTVGMVMTDLNPSPAQAGVVPTAQPVVLP